MTGFQVLSIEECRPSVDGIKDGHRDSVTGRGLFDSATSLCTTVSQYLLRLVYSMGSIVWLSLSCKPVAPFVKALWQDVAINYKLAFQCFRSRYTVVASRHSFASTFLLQTLFPISKIASLLSLKLLRWHGNIAYDSHASMIPLYLSVFSALKNYFQPLAGNNPPDRHNGSEDISSAVPDWIDILEVVCSNQKSTQCFAYLPAYGFKASPRISFPYSLTALIDCSRFAFEPN